MCLYNAACLQHGHPGWKQSREGQRRKKKKCHPQHFEAVGCGMEKIFWTKKFKVQNYRKSLCGICGIYKKQKKIPLIPCNILQYVSNLWHLLMWKHSCDVTPKKLVDLLSLTFHQLSVFPVIFLFSFFCWLYFWLQCKLMCVRCTLSDSRRDIVNRL